MRRKRVQFTLLVLMILGFVFLATQVFLTRFESGDLYPKYSTYRSDPFGSKVLLKAFSRLDNVKVEVASDAIAFGQESDGQGKVVFLLGVSTWGFSLPEEVATALDLMIENGATVVVSIAATPDELSYLKEGDEAESEDVAIEKEESEKADEMEASEAEPDTLMGDAWLNRLSIGYSEIDPDRLAELEEGERILAVPVVDYLRSPLELSQPIELEFENEDGWTPLYSFEGSVVAAEHRNGEGRLILFTDTYPFSNEGLLNAANSELLAWILKGKRNVTFYESHLGVEAYYGLIALARLYGFDAALILFIISSAAFVWRGAFSAQPKREGNEAEIGLIDIDAVDHGLNGLLQRSIDRKSLCHAIYARWRRSSSARKLSKEREKRIDAALETYRNSEMKPEDITRFYNATVAILEMKGNKGS